MIERGRMFRRVSAEDDDSIVMDNMVIDVERETVRIMKGKGSNILRANGPPSTGLGPWSVRTRRSISTLAYADSRTALSDPTRSGGQNR